MPDAAPPAAGPEDSEKSIPDDHFLPFLGLELAGDNGIVSGRAAVRPQLFAPGTTRIRAGLLATMVDLVAGHVPNGPVGPTIDLRMELTGPTPTEGMIMMSGRALHAGKRLIVSETVMWNEVGSRASQPFGRALATFMNNTMGSGEAKSWNPPPMVESSFDEVMGARVRDEESMEMALTPRVANGHQGTMQGGAQAFLAEVAALHVLAPRYPEDQLVLCDIDVRYLGRARVGPLVAVVEELPGSAARLVRARVPLTDGDRDGHLVSFVAMTFERVER